MVCNCYYVKNYKIADNAAATKARKEHKHGKGILGILETF